MPAFIFFLISLIVSFQGQSAAYFVAAPSALGRDLERCLDLCETYSCQNDRNIKEGCNQMFSCAHGCKLRQLGLVHGNCRDQCRRNGQSGCGPNVSGWKFDLCRECNRGGCTPRPQVWECEQGCNFYKDTGKSGTEPSIAYDECQFKTCGELCQTGVCNGEGFCVNPEENPCVQHGCEGKPCGDQCLAGDIVGSCDIDGNCDFDIDRAFNSCDKQEAPKQEGESCGPCLCPPTYSAGDCAEGLTCERDERLPDAPGTCTRPEAPKQEGESCGHCFCPPTYSAGDCAEGLSCERDERLPDAPGICTRPEAPKQEGESCGPCFCPPTYSAGNCAEGLTCEREERLPDAPGICTRPDTPCTEPFAVPGPCKARLPRWSYNQETGICRPFLYGGCQGNNNNFDSKEECAATCQKSVGGCSRDELAFCPCTKEIDSVCAGGILYDNPCLYECAKKKAECATGQRFPNVGHIRECIGDCSRDEIDNVCSCTREYVPVCAGGIRYNNLCLYECAKKEAECATHQRFPNVLPPYSNGQCFSPDSNGRPSEIKCRDDEEHLDGDTLCCRKKNDHSIVYCA